jgi:hypothetical protein
LNLAIDGIECEHGERGAIRSGIARAGLLTLGEMAGGMRMFSCNRIGLRLAENCFEKMRMFIAGAGTEFIVD